MGMPVVKLKSSQTSFFSKWLELKSPIKLFNLTSREPFERLRANAL
jgi:hypothetical protein